ncbi:collagen alpha-1(IV) chain-like isoform X3 [Tympanuchus pallidicinctus]|uniref:collagen alpha-1(IV) chain-like isoform X3 n=1 Tax=Tympanuchus pallidicinctus TaxID=109042 RepID=UPI002286EEDC|nr:collagen alpha-1(IV) chain-like isoform X3 [Tympanuchus pallidicinctus]
MGTRGTAGVPFILGSMGRGTRMGTSGDPWMSPSSLWDGRNNQGSPSSLGLWGGGGRDPWGPQNLWDGDKRDSWGPLHPWVYGVGVGETPGGPQNLWDGDKRDSWGPLHPWVYGVRDKDGDKWGPLDVPFILMGWEGQPGVPFIPGSMGWGLERSLGVPIVPKPIGQRWGPSGSPSLLWGGGGTPEVHVVPKTHGMGTRGTAGVPFILGSMGWGLERPLGVPVAPKTQGMGTRGTLGGPQSHRTRKGTTGDPWMSPSSLRGGGGTPVVPTCAGGLKASEPSNAAALCCHLGVGGGEVTPRGRAPWCPQRPYDVPSVPNVPLSPHSVPMRSPVSPY